MEAELLLPLQYLTQLVYLDIGLLDFLSQDDLDVLFLGRGCFHGLRLRNVWLHRKADNASSNLHSLCHLWLKFYLALGKDKSSKLAQVIFKIEATIFLVVFYQCMTPTYRYV